MDAVLSSYSALFRCSSFQISVVHTVNYLELSCLWVCKNSPKRFRFFRYVLQSLSVITLLENRGVPSGSYSGVIPGVTPAGVTPRVKIPGVFRELFQKIPGVFFSSFKQNLGVTCWLSLIIRPVTCNLLQAVSLTPAWGTSRTTLQTAATSQQRLLQTQRLHPHLWDSSPPVTLPSSSPPSQLSTSTHSTPLPLTKLFSVSNFAKFAKFACFFTFTTRLHHLDFHYFTSPPLPPAFRVVQRVVSTHTLVVGDWCRPATLPSSTRLHQSPPGTCTLTFFNLPSSPAFSPLPTPASSSPPEPSPLHLYHLYHRLFRVPQRLHQLQLFRDYVHQTPKVFYLSSNSSRIRRGIWQKVRENRRFSSKDKARVIRRVTGFEEIWFGGIEKTLYSSTNSSVIREQLWFWT